MYVRTYSYKLLLLYLYCNGRCYYTSTNSNDTNFVDQAGKRDSGASGILDSNILSKS